MSSKIALLLKRFDSLDVDDFQGWANEIAEELRAAPVVERQPVELPRRLPVRMPEGRNLPRGYASAWNDCIAEVEKMGPLYTAPPELAELQESLRLEQDACESWKDTAFKLHEKEAELQATIAQLETKLNNAINLDFERRETIAKLTAEKERLKLVEEVWKLQKDMPAAMVEALDEIQRLEGGQRPTLKIGSGVTIENVGFSSDRCGKPYLRFDIEGNLTEVNLTNVAMVSKLGVYTLSQLSDIGVRVAQPAPVSVDGNTRSDKYRAELYDEVWQQARDMGFANVTDALERLNTTRPSHANAPADSGTHPHNDGLDDYRGKV